MIIKIMTKTIARTKTQHFHAYYVSGHYRAERFTTTVVSFSPHRSMRHVLLSLA